jgi:hypothetical protein
MPEQVYQVLRRTTRVYNDKTGSPVNGFELQVFVPEFDETYFVDVPDMDAKKADAAIMKLINQARELSKLGGG